MSRTLVFVAYGRPAPQGSKHGGAAGQLREASRYLPAWRREVVLAAQRARLACGWTTARGPCQLDRVFWQHRGVDTTERPHLFNYPASPPDLDKLSRAVADALTAAGVWLDDGLWVRTTLEAKVYCGARIPEISTVLDKPGAWIRVVTLEDE